MEPEIRKVPVGDLREGPIRHEGLSEALLNRIREVWNKTKDLYPISLEQFELGFMRDANPESEIRIWEDMSDAVDEGVKELQQSRTQVFKMVIGISVGAISTAEVKKSPTLTTIANIYVAIKNRR